MDNKTVTIPRNMNEIMREVIGDYIKTNPVLPEEEEMEAECLMNLRNEIAMYNCYTSKDNKLRIPVVLSDWGIAQLLLKKYHIVNVCFDGLAESAYSPLAIYIEDGEKAGTYSMDENDLKKIIVRLNNSITQRGINEVLNKIKLDASNVYPCTEPNLIAVNNGIFDFDTKTLLPFTPDKVFLTKSKVNYNPNAKNITIHNPDDGTDWDVESWMNDLSDDKEVVEVLWQILGAIIRQNVPWNKSAWFYSESGNNGKGTLCELMRQLCGEGSYKSIKLEDMGKEFLLEPLVGASAIIVDENDVGTYIDKAANLKAIVTGDVIQINRKFKQPISFRFRGFMVQCLNEMPRVKDKSDSFFRRQLFIPFTKCFTGVERKYIKQDYLKRTEVLEYVLYKVLNMNYYELSTPDVCKDALEEYKEFNDPILQFVNEILPQLQWDLVPFTFLYSLYRAWFDRYIPSGSPQSRNTFIKDLLIALKDNDMWECSDKNAKVASVNRMDKPEWLIDEYKLEDWYSQTYKGADRAKKCCPSLKASYRGIVRK